ncbi:hypothetical protein [Streptomyces pinistramenti]|nr:hypothetical protein [Streptomyces pinistramenti]
MPTAMLEDFDLDIRELIAEPEAGNEDTDAKAETTSVITFICH